MSFFGVFLRQQRKVVKISLKLFLYYEIVNVYGRYRTFDKQSGIWESATDMDYFKYEPGEGGYNIVKEKQN